LDLKIQPKGVFIMKNYSKALSSTASIKSGSKRAPTPIIDNEKYWFFLSNIDVDDAHAVQPAAPPDDIAKSLKQWQLHEYEKYEKLPSLSDFAKELKMTTIALYRRLHGERVLYHRRKKNESETSDFLWSIFVYAPFSRMNLFITRIPLDEDYYWNLTNSETLKVTKKGQDLIRKLAKIPSAKALCLQLSKVK